MSKNGMSSGQARSIKLTGDKLRKYFATQCTDLDGYIKKEHLIGLTNQTIEGSYVLKSGKNWQFNLGSFSPFTDNWNIEIIDHGRKIKYNKPHSDVIHDIRSNVFLKSFMVKSNFFVVRDTSNWLIFDSQDIISLIQDSDKVRWRILESGRIKGDFYAEKNKRTIFTLEYRAESHKKQFVFGAHGGGAGEKLKSLLKEYLFFKSTPIDYELWQ